MLKFIAGLFVEPPAGCLPQPIPEGDRRDADARGDGAPAEGLQLHGLSGQALQRAARGRRRRLKRRLRVLHSTHNLSKWQAEARAGSRSHGRVGAN